MISHSIAYYLHSARNGPEGIGGEGVTILVEEGQHQWDVFALRSHGVDRVLGTSIHDLVRDRVGCSCHRKDPKVAMEGMDRRRRMLQEFLP